MTDKALSPIEQKQVVFYDDEITAVLVQEKEVQQVYIPLRPICDHLGLDWSAQTRRIRRDLVLSKCTRFVAITATNPEQAKKGGNPNMLCLPLDYLNGFLFGISANRVKVELRERVILYQERCYRVLAEAFQEGRLTQDPSFDELLKRDTGAVRAYEMLQAMVKLARNQILLESRLEMHDGRLDDYEKRLEQVEATLGDTGRNVTPDQAMQISQAVKTVAIAFGKQTKKNEFGAVYGELYRKFGITSYKLLPEHRFEAAMKFLTNWHQDVEGDMPF
ncbi:MAG: hypothetical protein GY805_35985 [Chloroflexi bacterium]|nr:hypothetical protein [Chloroflexota bacterium]